MSARALKNAMKEKRSCAVSIAIAVLLLLPVLYVGSYLFVVRIDSFAVYPNGEIQPRYHWGGAVSEYVYWPLWTIDRRIRPELWTLKNKIS
jgi:hypothetical protein